MVMLMVTASSAERNTEFGMKVYTGDFGDSKTVTNEPTEIIRLPSAQPSIKYSGQCSHNARLNDTRVSCIAVQRRN